MGGPGGPFIDRRMFRCRKWWKDRQILRFWERVFSYMSCDCAEFLDRHLRIPLASAVSALILCLIILVVHPLRWIVTRCNSSKPQLHPCRDLLRWASEAIQASNMAIRMICRRSCFCLVLRCPIVHHLDGINVQRRDIGNDLRTDLEFRPSWELPVFRSLKWFLLLFHLDVDQSRHHVPQIPTWNPLKSWCLTTKFYKGSRL